MLKFNSKSNKDTGFSAFEKAYGFFPAAMILIGLIFCSWVIISKTPIPGMLITIYLVDTLGLTQALASLIQVIASISIGLILLQCGRPKRAS